MKSIVLLLVLYSFQTIFAQTKINPQELKCLVCEKTIEEVENIVNKLDPSIHVDAGGYRLDASGNLNKKTVPQTRSELHLSEILDKICEKMDDYVRATWKTSGKLTLLKLMDPSGNMSKDMSKVDIIQDSDLNKSLKYYCEGLVEEHEDAIIKSFAEALDNIDIRICTMETKYCSKTLPTEDYINDEL
ncbi:PREDICTED: protein canopy homolog 2 [Nicrophorus vespilloides]|uniref:Protein canopy homolog 2 n=1 Tax=Nicrophorus vespilloides TaxID=110193 RepID=A0ABM1MRN5_NICVS|nr:PREDICTED: protein canopy homolog 2 [Nicrophorus vespilloides]